MQSGGVSTDQGTEGSDLARPYSAQSVRNKASSADMKTSHHDPEASILDLAEHPSKVQPEDRGLKRKLQGRHLRFLALGSSIGTGLFVGSGNILATGGPGSMMINFILLATMVITVIFAVGELVSLFPVAGAYSVMISRFIDPSLGFAIGLNYLMTWLIILPVELTTVCIVVGYWDEDGVMPKGTLIAIVLVAVFCINLFGVRAYGEFEFFATSIKIVSLVGFIIGGVVITCGGSPSGHYLGAHNWHLEGGAFINGFKGFCSVFVFGAFAFGGSELIGLAAAEAAEPRKQLPRACKMVVWRVLIFFILALFIVTLIVPYNDSRLLGSDSPRASPFVLAIKIGGIKSLPSVFNGAILISVISVANSAVYAASRLLVGMAEKQLVPSIFKYTDRQGRPLVGFVVVFLFGLLAFLVYSTSENEVFNWLIGISGLSTIFVWFTVCAAHIRFRNAWKAQGYTIRQLPWSSPLGVYGSWFGFIINGLLLAGNFYYSAFPIGEGTMSPMQRAHDFFESMISAPIVIFFFISHKIFKRTRTVRFNEIDLDSDRRDPVSDEVLARERAERAEMPIWKRVLQFLF